MYDVVKSRGDHIDIEALSEKLGAIVVPTIATKKEGIEELKDAILAAVPPHVLRERENERVQNGHHPGEENGADHLHYHPKHHHHGEYERLSPPTVKYSPEVEQKLKRIVMILEDERKLLERFPPRWLALRLLERDPEIMSQVQKKETLSRVLEVTL
jgi:ferrous iron transport protein B